MGSGSEREKRGSRPAEKEHDRMREQRAHPAEVAFYARATTDERRVALGDQCSTEEDREKKEDNAANLAGERGARRRAIAPVPARAS